MTIDTFNERLRPVADFGARALKWIAPDPPDDPEQNRTLRDERFIGMTRAIGALFTLPVVPIISSSPSATYGIIAFAFAYDALIVRVLIPRGSPWLMGGLLGFILDVLAMSVCMGINGGAQSDYFVIFYVLAAVWGFRSSPARAVLGSLLVVPGYAAAVVLSGTLTETTVPLALFRLSWIPLIASFGSVLLDRLRSAEASLALELGRTRGLLRAAHAPMTSLTVSGVLDGVLEQARRLTDSDLAIVVIDGLEGSASEFRYQGGDPAAASAMARTIQRSRRAQDALLEPREPITPAELATRLSAIPAEISEMSTICAAPVPGPHRRLGLVVVGRSHEPKLSPGDFEILAAFLERATLAIQNARLYEQLQAQVEELRSLHDQVVGAERLAALGQLAAKVAHELNNPLASIHMYNSLLLEGPADEEEQHRLAESVQEQVERAKQVVMEVLDYSRQRPLLRELLDIGEAVRYGLRLVQHAARPAQVKIVEEYASDLPLVLLDRGHIAQIVTNLTLNAIQAMPDGGTLTISTGAEDGEVYFRFRDTGVGIAPDDEKRIFDAFFTTKPPGQGTGLGLAVCRTIIGQHHGRISVDSRQGAGSTFTVWLPPASVEEAMVVGTHSR